ncbi:MAG: hypothetical protein ABL951_02620 [Alphaproteobacteria bacterium]
MTQNSAWKPVDDSTPRDRPILVRGGTVFLMADDWRALKPMQYSAAVARWEYYGHGRGWWIIPGTPVRIMDPMEWMEMPE